MMLSHVNLGTNDLSRAIAFYDAVLAPLGIARFITGPTYAGWRATPHGPALYIGHPIDGTPAAPASGSMLAFHASDTATVDTVHRLALHHGGTDAGPPGPRDYKPGYYGAYARDPDGHKLHVVHQP